MFSRLRLALLCLLLPTVSLAAPLRILCIGDSLTQGKGGDDPEFTYRVPLQRMLSGLGIAYDFVGTRNTGLDAKAFPPTFDPDHEGYYGETTAQVQRHLHETLPRFAPPDVVLIHLGTNDASHWDLESAIIRPMTTLVNDIRGRNSRVAIFIGEPNFHGLKARWRGLALSAFASRMSTEDSPIVFVPSPETWSAPRDTFDGIHPNVQGQLKMASTWLGAMSPLVLEPDTRLAAR